MVEVGVFEQQVAFAHAQAIFTVFFDPLFKRDRGMNAFRQTLEIEFRHGLFINENAAAARFVFKYFEFGEQFAVIRDGANFAVDFATDQRFLNKDFVRKCCVLFGKWHFTAGDNRQTIEQDALCRHDVTGFFRPMRLAVAVLDQMFGQLFEVCKDDGRAGAGKGTVNIDNARRHHRLRLFLIEHGTGEDEELTVARAGVILILFVPQANLVKEASEQGAV